MPDHRSTFGSDRPEPAIPPVPAGYLERPRVRQVLDAAHPMTVLRAPVGFGKTAAIAAWLGDDAVAAPGTPGTLPPRGTLVWHSLTAPPVSALSFWAALAADLSTVLAPSPASVTRLTTYDDVHDLVAGLTSPLLLVVDGLETAISSQTSSSTPVGEIVTDIVNLLHCSTQLRVVLACRPYGVLATDALFGDDAQILDSDALILTETDTLDLARAAHVPMTPAQAQHLQSKLWGWPVLTYYVVDQLGSSGTGYTESSWETGCEHLWTLDTERLDPEVNHFLTQVSILDTITGPIATSLTGSPDANRVLAELEQGGLARSVMHDGERHFTLLPAIEHAILTSPAAAAEHATAHRHAAKMLRNWPTLALRHAVLAQDWDLVLSICDAHTVPLVLDHPQTLLATLQRVPDDFLGWSPEHTHLREVLARFEDDGVLDSPTALPGPDAVLDAPALCRALAVATAQILALRSCHHDAEAHDLVVRCAQMRLRPGLPFESTGAALPLFLLHAGITRCLVGDLTAAVADFEECAERASTGMEFLSRAAVEYSALAQALLGDLSDARDALERSRRFPRALATLHCVDDRLDLLVGALIEMDQLNLAEAWLLLPPSGSAPRPGVPPAWFVDEYVRAHLRVLRGDLFSATIGLSRALADRRASLGRGTLSARLLTATGATINVWGGNSTRAKNFLDVVPRVKLVDAVHADVALQVGDVEAALAIADGALADPDVPGRLRVEMLLTRTVARDRQGDRAGAAADLREAIATADPLLLRPFLVVPRPLFAELVVQVPEASEVLARLEASGITLTTIEHQPMVTLSADELVLLRALDAGATIDAIASALGVSFIDTLAMVEELFEALGVPDRLGAVAAGHMLGYLGVLGP